MQLESNSRQDILYTSTQAVAVAFLNIAGGHRPPLQLKPHEQPNGHILCLVGVATKWWISLSFDPDFPVFEEFFFPDGNDFFELVDRVMTGIECRTAVSGSNNNRYTRLSDVEVA